MVGAVCKSNWRKRSTRSLLDGFFPAVEFADKSMSGESQEFGSPHVADPVVTRQLAEFLNTHRRTCLETAAEDSTTMKRIVHAWCCPTEAGLSNLCPGGLRLLNNLAMNSIPVSSWRSCSWRVKLLRSDTRPRQNRIRGSGNYFRRFPSAGNSPGTVTLWVIPADATVLLRRLEVQCFSESFSKLTKVLGVHIAVTVMIVDSVKDCVGIRLAECATELA